eukprot:gnl/TRDRNA2_/TRDRNA2_81411_c0_seq1.p1 gnl/TRDRNA2_/TRDRNA2_81411_c0~~gnl/TRDRNA2_/TRDRNA2_81411_c0_seq1.p1  ORF type:complete len:503 (+),score=116.31 gnl/TRDRNA2_/TRDRNA2_81411_c0_seq1:22-1530(+)
MFLLEAINQALCQQECNTQKQYRARGTNPHWVHRQPLDQERRATPAEYYHQQQQMQQRDGYGPGFKEVGNGFGSGISNPGGGPQTANNMPLNGHTKDAQRQANLSHAQQAEVDSMFENPFNLYGEVGRRPFSARNGADGNRNGPAATQKQASFVEVGKGNSTGSMPAKANSYKFSIKEKDTRIGKGFASQMKDSLRKAEESRAEAQERPQVVEQGAFGFIATLQKGFADVAGFLQGFERPEGPLAANEYEAYPDDDIDKEVEYFCKQLDEEAGGVLMINRIEPTLYEIDNQTVRLAWVERPAPPPGASPNGKGNGKGKQQRPAETEKEVFVYGTGGVDGKEAPLEPLSTFLMHAASVAQNLKTGGNMVTQMPKHLRQSFAVSGTKLHECDDGDSRFNAMVLARDQVKMREKAAEDWRNGVPPEAQQPAVEPVKAPATQAVQAPATTKQQAAAAPMMMMSPYGNMAGAPMRPGQPMTQSMYMTHAAAMPAMAPGYAPGMVMRR